MFHTLVIPMFHIQYFYIVILTHILILHYISNKVKYIFDSCISVVPCITEYYRLCFSLLALNFLSFFRRLSSVMVKMIAAICLTKCPVQTSAIST